MLNWMQYKSLVYRISKVHYIQMSISLYMSYERHRFKGPCQLCKGKAYRKGLCLKHYKAQAKQSLHCTVVKCHRPIFSHTLCRTHFKSFNSWCRIEDCSRHTVCNGMCNYHYRRQKLPRLVCIKCTKTQFMNELCFKHYMEERPQLRKCTNPVCSNMRVARGMCRKHYQAWRRIQSSPPSEPPEANA